MQQQEHSNLFSLHKNSLFSCEFCKLHQNKCEIEENKKGFLHSHKSFKLKSLVNSDKIQLS